jgi:O-6-methylguanine DNA methyltransferase
MKREFILKKIKKYPEFYQKVWIACLNIPKGTTKTYKDIAIDIGHKSASRAVGNALAKNPFPPFIPCHRVIRSDGKLGGYSGKGGIKMKKKLLNEEKNLI